MLEDMAKIGHGSIVSWQPHGMSFRVHQPEVFTRTAMSRYFKQTKHKSFLRQLHVHGFHRIAKGRDKGACIHGMFIRNEKSMSLEMTRQRIKAMTYPAIQAIIMLPVTTQTFIPRRALMWKMLNASTDITSRVSCNQIRGWCRHAPPPRSRRRAFTLTVLRQHVLLLAALLTTPAASIATLTTKRSHHSSTGLSF
jgi:hypothetical protein